MKFLVIYLATTVCILFFNYAASKASGNEFDRDVT